MVEVLHQLLRDHVNMRELLDLIEEQMAAFGDTGAADLEFVRTIMRYTLEYPARIHERRELLVYERLVSRQESAAEALGELPSEHGSLAELTVYLANHLNGIEDAGTTERRRIAELAADYVSAYRRHIDIEELRFFPMALKHLVMNDWNEIDATVTAPDDPVFGIAALEPFIALRRRITAMRRRHAPVAAC